MRRLMADKTTLPPSSLIPLLAGLVALGPISIDLYLPSLPTLVEVFGTNLSRVQLSMSSFLAGFALFHLLCGPLADSFGRKPVLIAGLVLFTASSLACAMSQNIEDVIMWRFLQGVGACVGPTLGRAVARDLFEPREAARVLAIIAMLMGIAPAVAPTLGGLMLVWTGWEAIFVTTALGGASLIVWTLIKLPESVPIRQAFHPTTILGNYRELLTHGFYWQVVLASAAIYSGMMSFVAGSSFVLIDMKGVKPEHFGPYFFFIVLGYISGSYLTSRLSGHKSPGFLLRLGSGLSLCAITGMFALELMAGTPLATVVPMAFYSAGIGLVLPNATAFALRPFAHMAATASAMFGFVQMGLAALVTALVGLALTYSIFGMLIIMFGLTVVGSWLIYRLSYADTDDPI